MTSAEHEPLRAGFRNAIHVPFIIVSCDETISPGDKCSLRDGNKCVRWASRFEKSTPEPMWHGVANPFCEYPIPAGELFPLYLRKECFGKLKKPLPPEAKNWPWLKTDECGRPTGLFVKVHGRWRRVGKSRKTVQ